MTSTWHRVYCYEPGIPLARPQPHGPSRMQGPRWVVAGWPSSSERESLEVISATGTRRGDPDLKEHVRNGKENGGRGRSVHIEE